MEEFKSRILEQKQVTFNVIQIVNDCEENNSYTLKLYKSEQSYCLDKEFFNYFLQQNDIINDDIDINKLNIEFYDFHNEEFINQDDDILGEDNSFYIFPPEFLWNEQEMAVRISPQQQYKFNPLISTLQNIEDFQQLKLIEIYKQISEENNKISQQLTQIKEKVQQKEKQNLNSEQNNQKMIIIYSNPILQQSSNNEYEPANFIDYETEIIQLQGLQKQFQVQVPIDIQFYQATKENLIKVLKEQPSIIHIIANGGYDLNKAEYYLEFNKKGLVDRLYLKNFVKILKENEEDFLKIKLICISSLIGIQVAKMLQQINQNLPLVSASRLWNQKNNLVLQFWKLIYTEIFLNGTITTEILQNINKIMEKQQQEQSMCCCLHEHQKECLENYQNIGYQKFHEEHKDIKFHIGTVGVQFKKHRLDRLNQLQPQKQLLKKENKINEIASKFQCCCKFYYSCLKYTVIVEEYKHQFCQQIYQVNLNEFKLNNSSQNQVNYQHNRNIKQQIIFLYQDPQSNTQLTSESIFEVVIQHFQLKSQEVYIPIINMKNNSPIELTHFNKQNVKQISKITDDMFKNEKIKTFIMKLFQDDEMNDDRIILFEITDKIQKEIFQEKGESQQFQFLEYY